MRRRFVFLLALHALLISWLYVRIGTVEVKALDDMDISKVYAVKMLWNNSMTINDVAVSKDGNYIATVNNTGVYYYASNNSTPRWWHLNSSTGQYFYSVAISADGEYVVAGDSNGFIHYFNNSTIIIGERVSPIWTSIGLFGPVERGTLDMSDDGDYIALGGTGIVVWYFADCRGRSGQAENPTWSDMMKYGWDITAVDMSPDGKYVAAGGTNISFTGFVVYYKNADVTPYPTGPDWESGVADPVRDLAVSDDGYAVVTVDGIVILTLYYWANATTLSGYFNATWTSEGSFLCVDMSSDGDEVIAGISPLVPCGLHFWSGARSRSGPGQVADWTRIEGGVVLDVAISDDGGIIAAATVTGIILQADYQAIFFRSDGTLIGQIDLPFFAPMLSMSGDGRIVAMGDPGLFSLYIFKVLEDLTPPLIENVYQEPSNDTVTPDDEVMVYANVTDEESGVKQVLINYTTNGAWTTINMTNLGGELWNGTIQAFDLCTWVNYTVIAEDKVGNIITTEDVYGYQYQYHVIPEFPLFLILPLFIATALLSLKIHRRGNS